MSYYETAARAEGYQGLAEAFRKIFQSIQSLDTTTVRQSPAKPKTELCRVLEDIASTSAIGCRSSFGQIAPLDTVAKAELYLTHYGWRHTHGDGIPLPSVADQAAIIDLICNRQMNWTDATRYLKFQKALSADTQASGRTKSSAHSDHLEDLRRLSLLSLDPKESSQLEAAQKMEGWE